MRFRALIGAMLALGLLTAPTATVVACSCSFLGGTLDSAKQAITDAELAFIGTVAATGKAPADPDGFGPMVRYAFTVERATIPVAEVVEVRALDDGGGASCGFTFGLGETWFVTTYQQDGVLHSGLCSGNTELGMLADVEREQISALLTAEPLPGVEPGPRGNNWLPIAGIAIAALILAAVMLVAFRRDGVS